MAATSHTFIAVPTHINWAYDTDRRPTNPHLTLTTVGHEFPGDPITVPITQRALFQLAQEHLPEATATKLMDDLRAQREDDLIVIDMPLPPGRPLAFDYAGLGTTVAEFKTLSPDDPRVDQAEFNALTAKADELPTLNRDWLSYMRGRADNRREANRQPPTAPKPRR